MMVLVCMMYTWCSVCRKEMPVLEKEVWQRFKGEDFLLIGLDLKENEEQVKKFGMGDKANAKATMKAR